MWGPPSLGRQVDLSPPYNVQSSLSIRLELCGQEQPYYTEHELWVTTMRDMTRLEAAETHFIRSVTGYTRLDKIRSEVIRKEPEILEYKT